MGEAGQILEDFNKKLHTPQTTDDYLRQYQDMKVVKDDIFDDIKKEYLTTRSFIGPENQTADLNVSSLLKTHRELQQMNDKLKPMIRISEQTCNQQGAGKGTCSYKN